MAPGSTADRPLECSWTSFQGCKRALSSASNACASGIDLNAQPRVLHRVSMDLTTLVMCRGQDAIPAHHDTHHPMETHEPESTAQESAETCAYHEPATPQSEAGSHLHQAPGHGFQDSLSPCPPFAHAAMSNGFSHPRPVQVLILFPSSRSSLLPFPFLEYGCH